MNRRMCLQLLPIVPIAAATAASLSAHTAETPVMALFREWEAKFRWIESKGQSLSDDEILPHYIQNDAQRDRVMAADCETTADFAAKLIAATLDGLHDLTDTKAGLVLMAQARALVGAA